MKDKLTKTNRKKGYYKMRKAAFVMSFLIIASASFIVPYRYVAEAVRAMQTEEVVETNENSELVEEVEEKDAR